MSRVSHVGGDSTERDFTPAFSSEAAEGSEEREALLTDAQAEKVIALLTEIRDALVPPATAEPVCTHPEEHRVNLGSMGELEWVCGVRDCRFHYGPVKREKVNATVSQ